MKNIVQMAHEAGIHVYPEFEKAFERFAELVRADEREACAKVCEELAETNWADNEQCATVIRARNNL